MKKKCLLIIAASLLLAGCGESGGTSTGGDPSTGEKDPPTPLVTQYLVSFKDENGNLLESKKWDEHTFPSYDYKVTDTAEWDYTFEGWSLTPGGEKLSSLPEVSEEVTYYAIVSKVKQVYTITFYDEDGGRLDQSQYEYGQTPSFTYTKTDTAEWDYTVQGWSTSKGGSKLASLPAVTADASYYAVVSKAKQKYNITFYDENGNKLGDALTEYGVVPSYSYTKQDTAEWDYTFEGWALTLGGEKLSSLPLVTQAASYYAVVSQVKQKYTITFVLNNGENNKTITAEYGTSYTRFDEPTRDGYAFAGWYSDSQLQNKITFPVTLTGNVTYYAKWNEKIDVKGYLQTLIGFTDHDPYSFIPETLRPGYTNNHIAASNVLDYSSFQSVSNIKTQGFGEQWQMVLDNMEQSEKFFSVFSISNNAFSAAAVAFLDYFDKNPTATSYEDTTAAKYNAHCEYEDGVIEFSCEFKNEISIPVLGSFKPQIEMSYNVGTSEKTIKITLNESNVVKCFITDKSYVFGIEYGITDGLRTAYCQLDKVGEEDETIQGHIYEYITVKDHDIVNSCADFYIDDTYCTVIGNKSSGLIGFAGFINELYTVSNGRLVGYMVQEEREIPIIGGMLTYHTFWFNLANITNITNVKAIKKTTIPGTNENPHEVYLNNSTKVFTPEKNGSIVKTSRKYDVEMRLHYYYGISSGEVVKYETEIPMMFVQDDDAYYNNGYKNTDLTDFPKDMEKSGISGASINLSSTYVDKIRQDNLAYVDVFKTNKELVNASKIDEWLD